MFKSLGLENIIKGKQAIGLEIILLSEGLFEFNVTALKKTKSLIGIESKIAGIKNIEALSKVLDPKTPIIIIFNGKGIVHRKVNINENESTTSLLNKALPNANSNDFYFQKTEIDPSHAFVSIVRASFIDEIILKLKEYKITNIISCLLGPFIVQEIIPLLDHSIIKNERLSFNGFELLIREDRINDLNLVVDKQDSNLISIGDDQIEPSSIISFSAALSYFTNPYVGIENSELINSIKEEFKQKQKFQFVGWSLLIVALSILMINFMIFNNYWTKGNELSSELAINQSALNRYDTLKKEYLLKKIFLEENGLLENSKTSFYADRLAIDLPASIQWLDLNIHPLKKKAANDETSGLFFENKRILISGNCHRNTELNEWMKSMKNKEWIAGVTLINYKQDNASDAGLFLIEIKLK